MRHPANHIFHHTPESLKEWCSARGMKPFRAAQVLDWVYRKGVADPAAMSNLSAADRATLGREMTFLSGHTVAHQTAGDGVEKLLIEWDQGPTLQPGGLAVSGRAWSESSSDTPGKAPSSPHAEGMLEGPAAPTTTTADRPGLSSRLRIVGQPILGVIERPGGNTARQTECVMIPSEPGPDSLSTTPRRTACISSQVGCPVGCAFCASGLGGLDGNLSAGRIVEQVLRLARVPPRSARGDREDHPRSARDAREDPSRSEGVPSRITNVVFMGMGEPLSNFSAVVHAVRTLAAPWGPAISARKITISTVGLPKAIERLAAELDLPITLALSLHAPTDDLRRTLIPWAEYTTIAELLAACQKWFDKTGREITLEYTLLRNVNDRPEHADQLAQVAKTLRANINLIRYNEVAGLDFKRPRTADVLEFQRLLRAKGVNAHIRRSRGRDIAAACGQLRHEAAGA